MKQSKRMTTDGLIDGSLEFLDTLNETRAKYNKNGSDATEAYWAGFYDGCIDSHKKFIGKLINFQQFGDMK